MDPSPDPKQFLARGWEPSGTEGQLCLLIRVTCYEGLEHLLGGLEPIPSRPGIVVKFWGCRKLHVGFRRIAVHGPVCYSRSREVVIVTTFSLSALREGRVWLSGALWPARPAAAAPALLPRWAHTRHSHVLQPLKQLGSLRPCPAPSLRGTLRSREGWHQQGIPRPERPPEPPVCGLTSSLVRSTSLGSFTRIRFVTMRASYG